MSVSLDRPVARPRREEDPAVSVHFHAIHKMARNAQRYLAVRAAFLNDMQAEGSPLDADMFDAQADMFVAQFKELT